MNSVALYKTVNHPCAYLDKEKASNLVVDPELRLAPVIYEQLLLKGFRRSGCMVYRPDCPACNACQSSRIPVSQFSPDRSQRRAWKKVSSRLSYRVKPAIFDEHQYQLYQRYTATRHGDGDMQHSGPDDYLAFLHCEWCETRFVEIRLEEQLLAVAATDVLPQALSAVYTWFDPHLAAFSPGVLGILCQIELAKMMDKDWLYLGFWIEKSAKMAYKRRYHPLQVFHENRWQWLNPPRDFQSRNLVL